MPEAMRSIEEQQKILQKLKDERNILWAQLTDKQQVFVEAYVNTRNAAKAAKAAYTCQNDKAARNKGNNILRVPKVQTMVSYIAGYEAKCFSRVSRDEALQLISERLRDAKVDAPTFTRLMQMYLTTSGLEKPREVAESSSKKPAETNPFDEVLRLEKKQKEQSNVEKEIQS